MEHELHTEVTERLGGTYSGRFADPLDAADLSFSGLLESVDVGLVVIRQEELGKMLQAERMLNNESYGICEECGGEINVFSVDNVTGIEADQSGGGVATLFFAHALVSESNTGILANVGTIVSGPIPGTSVVEGNRTNVVGILHSAKQPQ